MIPVLRLAEADSRVAPAWHAGLRLPVPGNSAADVQDLLKELGLRQCVSGRWVHDDRHLCRSLQERLFITGQWQDGLLSVQDMDARTLADGPDCLSHSCGQARRGGSYVRYENPNR